LPGWNATYLFGGVGFRGLRCGHIFLFGRLWRDSRNAARVRDTLATSILPIVERVPHGARIGMSILRGGRDGALHDVGKFAIE